MRKVISASRRIDLVAGYPDRMVEGLAAKAPPEATHTVVVWTKDPSNMLDHAPLRTALQGYDSLFLHLTVTGMGGGPLEHRVPEPHLVLERLPEVLDLVATGRLDPLAVPTTVVDWEQADRRWLESAIKMVVARGI